jgi:glycosyltransferase involved in cell wall biosynthesis
VSATTTYSEHDGRPVGFAKASAGGQATPIRVAVVGMSAGSTCGARDHAVLLADGLSAEGVTCRQHWFERSAGSLRSGRSEVRAWTRALTGELEESRPDAVLLHYSVFAYSHRGVPFYVAPVLSALRGARVPVVTVLHEFVYPWRHRGWRARAWALTQRALLVEVMRSSAAVVLTTDFRVEWLATRPWLPQRPAAMAPVFSNLPPAARTVVPDSGARVIGLFGYSFQGAAAALVLRTLALLEDRGVPMRLALLGAPGRETSVADAWLRTARAHGVEYALSFSGTLSAQDLSAALAACELLLFVDDAGPSSRKSTLAASLASGRPVVAIDGPRSWSELVESGAAEVVAPTAEALADAIGALLADEARREELGARGRAFARQGMSVERAAETVASLLTGTVRAHATR